MEFLLACVGVLILILGLRYVLLLRLLYKLTLCCRWMCQPQADVPDYIETQFAAAIATLTAADFHCVGYYPLEAIEGERQWAVLLHDPAQQIYATLALRPLNQRSSGPLQIRFVSFVGQQQLTSITEREYRLVSYPPHHHWQCELFAPLETLLQRHQHQLQARSATAQVTALSVPQYLDRIQAFGIQEGEYMVASGQAYWVKPQETYRFHWRVLPLGVLKVMRVNHQVNTIAKARAQQAPAAPPTVISAEHQLALELSEFERRQQQRPTPLSRRSRQWLFLGTLALFITIYAPRFNLQQLLIFVGVLLLHEGGHVLAMKLFGYRDAAILFVPFLGALATARKEDATLTEKIWIALAGPLPGLLLAIGMAIAIAMGRLPANDWSTDAILYLVLLNLFNLLPVYPLDGGQVADLLLFSRYPYLGVGFKLLGVVLFGLLGWVAQQPLMVLFALLMGLSIPNHLRQAQLDCQLRHQASSPLDPGPDRFPLDRVRPIFERLQQAPYHQIPFEKKYQLAKGILNRQRSSTAPRATRTGFVLLYIFSLVVGLIGGSMAIVVDMMHRPRVQPPKIAREERPRPAVVHPYRCPAGPLAAGPLVAGALVPEESFSPNPAWTITAVAPNQHVAAQVTAALSDYFAIARHMPLVAPWQTAGKNGDPLRAQQHQARHTYAQLLAAQTQSIRSESQASVGLLPIMAASLSQNETWMRTQNRRRIDNIYTRQKRALLAFKARQSAQIDPETVNLVLQQLHLKHQLSMQATQLNAPHTDSPQRQAYLSDLKTIRHRLLERLGGVEPPIATSRARYILGHVRQLGPHISLEQVYTDQPSQMLPQIMAYLCRHQFADITFGHAPTAP